MAIIVLIEAVGILFFGFVQLLTKNKQSLHYLMVASCLTAGYWLLYSGAVETGLILRFPVLIGSDIAVLFLAAPCLHLAAVSILAGGRKPVRSFIPYFAAVVPFALAAELYNLSIAPAYLRTRASIPGHFGNPFLTALTLLADLAITAALFFALVRAFRTYKTGTVLNTPGFRHQVAALICYQVAALVLIAAVAFQNERLYLIGGAILGGIVLLYGLSRTTASYFPGIDGAAGLRTRRPEWDQTGVELLSQLDALMEASAPYRDAELTLRRLARLLDVEPKRLSYHLRMDAAMTFRSYINDWRLRSVCRDLLHHTDHSILDIAFDNGFNSKSTFNALFIKKFSKTPRQFRRESQAARVLDLRDRDVSLPS